MGYKWLPVTEDFDKTLVIKKWRLDVNIPISGNYDGALSELPNIDIKTCWNNSQPSNGYAFSNRFNLGTKYFSSRYYGFTDGYWTATTTSHTTQVDGTIYEFECPVDLYWAGNRTDPWNSNIENYMWFYVQASTFEISPSALSASYTSGSTAITVDTGNDTGVTWTASTSNSWITLTNPTGSGDGSVTVTYTENPAFQDRSGSVTFTSSGGDVLTFTIEQEKKPVLVYDHPIYRSGNLVKKMYRSGDLIYYRLNPETPPCLTVSPVSGSVSASGSVTFTANYKPNCSRDITQNVTNSATWSVSPTGFGTVSNGVFTADNQDTASTSVTITAVYSGISATSTVEIEAYVPGPATGWVEITSGFPNNIPFTKIRWDFTKADGWATVNGQTANAAVSEIPNVNTDGMSWSEVSGSTYGYAGQNRFTLRARVGVTNGQVYSCRVGGFTDREMTQGTTHISDTVCEYTYPVTMYWAGIGVNTNPYSFSGGTGVYVYVEPQ